MRVDLNGALDGIFDEQNDGSLKQRKNVKDDGGERNHTFAYKNGVRIRKSLKISVILIIFFKFDNYDL